MVWFGLFIFLSRLVLACVLVISFSGFSLHRRGTRSSPYLELHNDIPLESPTRPPNRLQTDPDFARPQQPLPHHRPRWEIPRTHQRSPSQTIRRDPRESLSREIGDGRHPQFTVDGQEVLGYDFQICRSGD